MRVFCGGVVGMSAVFMKTLSFAFGIQCRFVALKTDHSFLRRNVETHTSSQRHNFNTTGVSASKSYVVQIETSTDISLLRSSWMAPFK
jgi:hypothetical protein